MTPIDTGIIQALRAATRVVVFTGTGVSAESGIPTFRDKQTGLWENFDAAELATPYAFERDPGLVWGWYEWRRAAVRNAQPNPAHRAIAAMANHTPNSLWSRRTSTTCTNAPAAATSCIYTASFRVLTARTATIRMTLPPKFRHSHPRGPADQPARCCRTW
jgi:hypothetical protein